MAAAPPEGVPAPGDPLTPSPLDAIPDMRATAKWIIGAAAAVAVALLGGAPLVAVGKVHGAAHAAEAFGGLTAGLIGVGWAIWHVADALIPPLTVPSSIDTEPCLADLRARVSQNPEAFYGPFGSTMAELRSQWAFHATVATNLDEALARERDTRRRRNLERALADARATLTAIERRTRSMVELAHAWHVRADLRRARLHAFIGAVLAALGAVAFLMATSSSTPGVATSALSFVSAHVVA